MTKIKIDDELIGGVMEVWKKFENGIGILGASEEQREYEVRRLAGYLTIAYMFGAEREPDEDEPKCEHCGHTPRCRLFGPPPDKCDWCGADLVKRHEIKVEEGEDERTQ